MKLHGNARTCPKSRRLLVERVLEQRWSLTAASEAAGVSERTARKWLGRFRTDGESGLSDRSSRPKRSPRQVPVERVAVIEALRRLGMTAAESAECLGMALSTVSRWLRRLGLGKRSRLEPPEPSNRYERKRPGELVHVDIKKLGRFDRPGHRITGRVAHNRRITQTTAKGRGRGVMGWDFCHVCVDDATRLAYVEVLDDEHGKTAAAFLTRAVAWFRSMGVTVERVMSDNGSCYISAAHATASRELGLRHIRTKPYRPRTNGKAERFIQTLQDRWAYGALYASSAERTAALSGWLNHYNFTRRHGSLSHKPPAARLLELEQPPG